MLPAMTGLQCLALSAHAQAPPPLMPSAGDACGSLCEMSSALVNGGAVVAAVAAVIVGVALHNRVVRSVAASWRGRRVTWGNLWSLPILSSAVTIVAFAGGLVLLGLYKSDFMVLLMHDWKQPLGAGLWLVATAAGVGGPPVLARISSKPTASARLRE